MNNKLIKIPAEFKLFRYDLAEPPVLWDSDYHSLEYTIADNKEVIHKNQAGLLFLFDSESTTIKTAELAMSHHNKTEFWLTTASVTKPLRLLDLRGGATLVIFNNLNVSGIDVFKSSLTIDGLKGSIPLADLEPLYDCVMQNIVGWDEYRDKWMQLHEPFIYPGSPYSVLGQRLTDFENGGIFKSLLCAKEFDGYIFDESLGASTVCLFDSNNLSAPESTKFDKPRLFVWNKNYYLRTNTSLLI